MTPHPLPLSLRLGTLTGGLGCFPLDQQAYPRWSDSRDKVPGYSELDWVWYPENRTLAHPVLYPPGPFTRG